MSNNKEEKCKEFWKKLFEEFKDLGKFVGNNNGSLIDFVNGNARGEDNHSCKENGNHKQNWKSFIEKLKNVGQSTAQQSGASSIALASTLGPAAGIGAGLSLFPLLSRITKFFK